MKQKASSYMDRAMKHRDPRYAKVLGKLGHYPSVAVTDNLETVPAKREASAVPAMTTDGADDAILNYEATDGTSDAGVISNETAGLLKERWDDAAKKSEAPVKPAEAEKPAMPKKRGRPPSAKLDHDDSGKAGGSRKKTAKEGRYKRRDMKAED